MKKSVPLAKLELLPGFQNYATINLLYCSFLYAILNEENLKNAVKHSLFLDNIMKQQILEYFENLSERQKDILQQGIKAEKLLMLQFLKQLKDTPEIKVSQIQEYYKRNYIKIRKNKEHTEELQNQEELENLLLELENT